MLLIYDDEALWGRMSDEERGKLFAEYGAYSQWLQDQGWYREGAPLQPTATATTVRVQNGQTLLSDGPFAETKEQLAGYYLIEVDSAEQATDAAARIPSARLGSIEVRPVLEME